MPLLANLAFLKVKLTMPAPICSTKTFSPSTTTAEGKTGLREHPGFSAYNKLFTTFSRGVKQLTDMMPNGTAAADALIDFINETRYG